MPGAGAVIGCETDTQFLSPDADYILLGVPARPQSVPSGPVSANDLAWRVVINELNFQDDHTNWMYRLEKEQYGKKKVEEIVETKEGSLSRLLSINDRPLTPKQQMEEDERGRDLMTSRSAERGDNVSTEDLRLALQRYRSFFDRFLKL